MKWLTKTIGKNDCLFYFVSVFCIIFKHNDLSLRLGVNIIVALVQQATFEREKQLLDDL